MVFSVLRINAEAEALFAFTTFQGKENHLYMALGLKSRKKSRKNPTPLKAGREAGNPEAGVWTPQQRSLLP